MGDPQPKPQIDTEFLLYVIKKICKVPSSMHVSTKSRISQTLTTPEKVKLQAYMKRYNLTPHDIHMMEVAIKFGNDKEQIKSHGGCSPSILAEKLQCIEDLGVEIPELQIVRRKIQGKPLPLVSRSSSGVDPTADSEFLVDVIKKLKNVPSGAHIQIKPRLNRALDKKESQRLSGMLGRLGLEYADVHLVELIIQSGGRKKIFRLHNPLTDRVLTEKIERFKERGLEVPEINNLLNELKGKRMPEKVIVGALAQHVQSVPPEPIPLVTQQPISQQPRPQLKNNRLPIDLQNSIAGALSRIKAAPRAPLADEKIEFEIGDRRRTAIAKKSPKKVVPLNSMRKRR